MPPKNQIIVISKNKTKMKNKNKNKVVVVEKRSKNKNRKNKRIKMKRTKNIGLGPVALQYLKCLSDPFKYGPVRAGFDVLVPTSLSTSYFRGTLIANVDGTLRIFCNPSLYNGINYSTGTHTAASGWASTDFSNATTLKSTADQFRVIGFGMRCFPRIAATNAPGMCFMNLVPKMDANELSTYANFSPDQASSMSYSQIHLASSNNTDFYQITWRPGGVNDFIFKGYDNKIVVNTSGSLTLNSLNSLSTGFADTTTAFLDVIFTGLPSTGTVTPVGTPVFFEVIVHYETTNSIESVISEVGSDNSPSVASEGSVTSLEGLYRSMVNSLPDTSTVVALGVTGLASPLINNAARQHHRHGLGYVNVVD